VETIEKTTYQPLWQKAFKIKKALQVIGKLFTGFLQTSCTFVQATQLLFSEVE
jgi:DNA-binding XRE family transcriptional regulator